MTILLLGLLIFLGVHSIRIFADPWRTRTIARIGLGPWKGIYALASIAGFVVIVWGFGLARAITPVLWVPPAWGRHVTALFVLVAFVLVVAAYVPRNHFKAALGHPMLAGVKMWALGHLLANGTLADAVLFGTFLVWAVVNFTVSRRRDRAAGVTYPAGTVANDVIVIVVGGVAWAAFAFWAHEAWIGVRPFG